MASICIFEDNNYSSLLPIVWMRPVFDLRCGISTLADKIRLHYPRVNTYIFCRDYLGDYVKSKYTGTIVNKLGKDNSILFINGSIIINRELSKIITVAGPDEIYECSGKVVAARLSRENLDLFKAKCNGKVSTELFSNFKNRVKLTKIDIEFIDYFFDLIKFNGREIENDFKDRVKGGLIKGRIHQAAILNPKGKIFMDDGSNIEAYAVLDAKDGPIYIGHGVNISHHTVIEGPVFIGDHSVVSGLIRKNTSIGPYSKVAGEVSGSIFQGYSNKAHYGYIGNSYIGEWVNLGAGTTNSNLKNNYGNIKVKYMDNEIDSKQMFLGAAIADHTKTGIGTLINSGSVFGISSNIFGGGSTHKFIPSFSWGGSDKFTVHELDKALKTAKAAMKRRGIEITEADAILFRKVFELTENERKLINK